MWILALGWVGMGLGIALQPAAAQTAPLPWTTPVDDSLLPMGLESRHFRITTQVSVPGVPDARELPVQAVLDLADILAANGHPAEQVSGRWVLQGFELDLRTFILHEINGNGQFLRRLPVMVLPGSVEDAGAFDPQLNPTVTLRWILPGTTTGPRQFHVYFDSAHNDPDPSRPLGAAEELQLATSIGPGPGTTLFVPLHSIRSAQVSAETRRVLVTALYDDTSLAFYEYRAGVPNAQPTFTIADLDSGKRSAYVLGSNGNQPSEGSVMVKATKPVLAEARSVPQSQIGSFAVNGFIPATEGGFLGKTFIAQPTAPQTLHAFCPRAVAATLPDGKLGCTFTVNDGQEQTVPANGEAALNLAAQQQARLIITAGRMMLQQQGTGLAYWPAVDGPALATQFLGYAGVGDHLLLTANADDTCVLVESRARGQFLTDRSSNGRLCLAEGAFRNCQCSWGTTTLRGWETDRTHDAGPLRIETTGGEGLGVWSGAIENPTNFNSLVVPQSPDGGLTYRIFVPASSTGAALGGIVLFSLQNGTEGIATREDGVRIDIPTLGAGERFDIREAGWWTVEMRRPAVAAWLKTGAGGFNAFGAYAPGFTDVAQVSILGADFAGYAIDVAVQGPAFLQRQPGDIAHFTLEIRNLARNTAGIGLDDEVTVRLDAPDGWTTGPTSTRALGAGQSIQVPVQAHVPQVPTGAGATLRALVTSAGNPDLEVEVILQVSLVIRRGVEIIEVNSANPDEAELSVGLGETASYTLRVTNKGSAPDSFEILYSPPPERWLQAVTPRYDGTAARSPKLDPGEHADVVLDVTPGPQVNLASKLVTRVSATSVADSSVTDSLRTVTVVGADRSFRVVVEAPTRTIEPGQETTFLVTVINDAQVNEELRIELASSLPPGWPAATARWIEEDATLEEVGNTVRIDAQGTATLSVTRAVPAGSPPLAMSVDRLRMQSQFDRDAAASDTALRVLAATVHGVQASLTGPTRPAEPGELVEFTLHLTSKGNANQTVRASPVLPSVGWNATTLAGASPPWDVVVAPGGNASLAARLRIPAGALPGKATIALSLGSYGVPTLAANLTIDIKELPALEVEDGQARLNPGTPFVLDVPVYNVGNVELRVEGRWTGLPDWDVVTEGVRLVPGQSGALRTRLFPPASLSLDSLSARLDALAGSTVLASGIWSFVPNGPRLEVDLQGVRTVDRERASYTVLVTNVGTHAAHNVSVFLVTSDGAVDRFATNEILAGSTATAVLLGPLNAQHAALRITADHDPDGSFVKLDAAKQNGGRFTPALPLGLALAAVALALRWRRP